MNEAHSYGIGEIARHTGVSVEALRFYEKRRLLQAPPRTEGGLACPTLDAAGSPKGWKQGA